MKLSFKKVCSLCLLGSVFCLSASADYGSESRGPGSTDSRPNESERPAKEPAVATLQGAWFPEDATVTKNAKGDVIEFKSSAGGTATLVRPDVYAVKGNFSVTGGSAVRLDGTLAKVSSDTYTYTGSSGTRTITITTDGSSTVKNEVTGATATYNASGVLTRGQASAENSLLIGIAWVL